MSYEWNEDPDNEFSGHIEVNEYATGGGWLTVESSGEAAVSELPTDSADVEELVRAILAATGCTFHVDMKTHPITGDQKDFDVQVVKRGE